MANLFGLNIAGLVNSSIAQAGGILDATLIKVTVGARTSGSITSGRAETRTTHAAKGIVSRFTQAELADTNINADDRAIVLLGASIAGGQVPQRGDEITIDGTTTKIVRILSVDPAKAAYRCQTR